MLPVSEVLARVVDDVVRADGSDQVRLGRAAHAGDLGAVGLGDLHGERADASGRADDQDLLPGLYLCLVPHGLQGGERGDGTAAACSKDRLTGLGASLLARVRAYGAKEPSQVP